MLMTFIDWLCSVIMFSFLYSMLFSKVGVTCDSMYSRLKSSGKNLFAEVFGFSSEGNFAADKY